MSATGRSDVRRVDDHYETPEWAVRSLLEAVKLQEPIFDPGAGKGAITAALLLAGYGNVYGLELDAERARLGRDRNLPVYHGDFLVHAKPGSHPRSIIANPPYSLAQEFIDKALEVVDPFGRVFMLLRMNFLASKTRHEWWRTVGLTSVNVLSRRPSFTNGGSDACDYAWLEFWPERRRDPPPQDLNVRMRWLGW